MKLTAFFLAFVLSASIANACPGAGQINLVNGQAVLGIVDEYNAKLTIAPGYTLEFLNTKLSSEDGGVDMLDIPGQWRWLCDQRPGIDPAFRAQRPYCSSLQRDQAGAYALPLGMRDFHISVRKNGDSSFFGVFKVEQANIDPNQPRARGLGCGRSVPLH